MDQIKTGKFIAFLRHSYGMTQEALGEKLGVTNKTISRWENGHYMPDIEMLKTLSDLFQVSINELICGERIPDEQIRKKADENLINVCKDSCFTYKDRIIFWKRRWLKDHAVLLFVSVLFYTAIWIFSIINKWTVVTGVCPLLAVIIYLVLRNKMMIYIEARAFDPPA